MSYTKHNFNSGDVLMASQLNEMEDQIALNETAIAGKQDTISDLQTIRSNASSALQEHQHLKTINGESLAGEGDITISTEGMTDAQKAMLYGKLTVAAEAPATDGTYSYYLNPDTMVLYKLASGKWTELLTVRTKGFNIAETVTGEIYNQFSDSELKILNDTYCNTTASINPTASYPGSMCAEVAVCSGTKIFYGIHGNITDISVFGKVFFCNADKKIMSGTTTLTYENEWSYLCQTIPDGCVYVYLPIKLNSTYDYSQKYMIGYMTTENESAVIFKGKTWLAMGDSLTERNLRAGKNYHDYVSEKTGITVINAGVSGTGYSGGISSETNFASRILNYADTDFDVVTVFGSGNDIGVTLGTEADTGTDTIGGLVNLFLDNLYSIKPFVKVGIISPCPWQNYTPDVDNNDMLRYAELLQKIARRRGIPFLDLYYSSGLHPDKSDFRSEFYSDDGPGGTGSVDGIHPNSKGHEILASHVLAFLKTLLLH